MGQMDMGRSLTQEKTPAYPIISHLTSTYPQQTAH